MNLRVKNALISVSNKENLISLLKTLKKFNINIISSGGTYTSIKKLGYKCTELAKYTGFKYMLVFFMIDKIKNTKMRCPSKIFLLLI